MPCRITHLHYLNYCCYMFRKNIKLEKGNHSGYYGGIRSCDQSNCPYSDIYRLRPVNLSVMKLRLACLTRVRDVSRTPGIQDNLKFVSSEIEIIVFTTPAFLLSNLRLGTTEHQYLLVPINIYLNRHMRLLYLTVG